MNITEINYQGSHLEFENASDAFDFLYDHISNHGINFDDTQAIFNCGILIKNPMDNAIHSPFRKWNKTYAEREWKWYLSQNPNANEIAKYAPIWYKMMDEDGNVRSNYGWQWHRESQLSKVIKKLRDNPNTRQATISIYDGKEIDTYEYDTPCTLAINFTIFKGVLDMSVYMRSNDLWYGFCNDQYCFSNLQSSVAKHLGLPVGNYYHHASNLHIYNDKLNKNDSNNKI